MPQRFVDPANAASAIDQIAINILPSAARNFGFVPSFSRCMPGDLILFRDVRPTRTSRLIARAQIQAGFSQEDSAWTHAAIFLYEDFVVEAIPWPGVHTRSLYSDVPNRILRVRRHLGLPDADRYKIALRALRMLGTRYGIWSTIRMGFKMTRGLWDANGSPEFQSSVICSKVFFDAYADITRSLLTNCPVTDAVLPAHLSATPDLEDIDVNWLRLSP